MALFPIPDSELVIGLVAPVGIDLETVTKVLTQRLEHFNYHSEVQRVSRIIERFQGLKTELKRDPYHEYLTSYMDAGNEARRLFDRGDILARSAISDIARNRLVKGIPTPLQRTAHIIRSLKHPDEAACLRDVYGSGFFLLGINSSLTTRQKYLMNDRDVPERLASELISRDEYEGDKLGQRVRDTFELCDAFLAIDSPDFKEQLWRVLDLLFGFPYITPTRDEYAMFMAYAASLRSADLSRQVGAVIRSQEGEIIATGANDVPRFGGGLYWTDDADDGRDYKWGFDTNARKRDEIVVAVMQQLQATVGAEPGEELLAQVRELLSKAGDLARMAPEEQEELVRETLKRLLQAQTRKTDEDLLAQGRNSLRTTGLLDLTEFGRVVHAEMEALLACARSGVSPRGGTLFSTTFPCHNCAKHIVAAGIDRVVYIEPYPKSLALELNRDSIQLVAPAREESTEPYEKSRGGKVAFTPFAGIGPRRFVDLFSMRLSSGREMERKDKSGNKIEWQRSDATLRVPMSPTSYLDRERLATSVLDALPRSEENAT